MEGKVIYNDQLPEGMIFILPDNVLLVGKSSAKEEETA
jgi:hypothetical protein